MKHNSKITTLNLKILKLKILVPTTTHTKKNLKHGPHNKLKLDPTTLQINNLIVPTTGQPNKQKTKKKKQFQFHNFFQIPLQINFNNPEPTKNPKTNTKPNPNTKHKTQIHIPTQIPNTNYTD